MTAGLSGLSLLSDVPIVTAILSVLTVLLAGTNAAFKPSQRASEHKEAAAGLFKVGEKYWLFANLKIPSSSGMTREQFDALVHEYDELAQERVSVLAKGPYLEPFERPEDSPAKD